VRSIPDGEVEEEVLIIINAIRGPDHDAHGHA
jgi:hypothetical protein